MHLLLLVPRAPAIDLGALFCDEIIHDVHLSCRRSSLIPANLFRLRARRPLVELPGNLADLLDTFRLSVASVFLPLIIDRAPPPQILVSGAPPATPRQWRRHPMVCADEALPMHQRVRPRTPRTARAHPRRARGDHRRPARMPSVEHLPWAHGRFAASAASVAPGPLVSDRGSNRFGEKTSTDPDLFQFASSPLYLF
jgi:hypothetical protein